MKSRLVNQLKSWDGIHIQYLTDIYESNYSDPVFLNDLVNIFVTEPDLQISATWLIKHHCDKGNNLSDRQTDELFSSGADINKWETKLHLLQILPQVTLSKKSLFTAESFVRNCLKDKNKFVRAWSYNGLYELTKHSPELISEVKFICQNATETESAAVKARVKKILTALNKKN